MTFDIPYYTDKASETIVISALPTDSLGINGNASTKAVNITYTNLDGTTPLVEPPTPTTDTTVPTLTAVSITSSNADTTRATTGDTVTVYFTASEDIQRPTVIINGATITATVTGDGDDAWRAPKIISAADSDGPVTFSISFTDLASNAGDTINTTTDNSAVTVYQTSTPPPLDTTVPTLGTVTIESSNSDPSRATTGDTITLSFTASEGILPPTVIINGATITAVAESGDTDWSATKTIVPADNDGPVTFTIAYSDLANNAGTPVTSLTAGSGVTIDKTAPTLTAVNIRFSDLDNTSSATTDDIITLRFRSSEDIQRPSVTINDDAPTTLTGNGKTAWTATRTITSGDTGIVMFTIDYSDLATNAGDTVTDTDDNTSVTVVQPVTPGPPPPPPTDTTPPTLTAVSIASNNSNPSLATTGDIITLSFTSSENIETPTVTFGEVAVASTVTGSNTSWTATKTITASDTDGPVDFTINYTDLDSNLGTPVISTIGGTSVTIDQTPPTLTAVSIASDNSNTSRATTGDTVTLSFTSSENIGTPTVTFGGGAASTVTGSNTSWSATKIITDADVDGSTVMFAIDYIDLASNDGIQVIDVTDSTGVTIDQPTTPPSTSQEIEIQRENLGVTNTGGIKFSIGGLDASTYYEYSTSKCDVADLDDETCSDFIFAKRSDSNGVLVIIMAGPFTREQYVFVDVKEIGKADPIYHTDFIVQVQNDGMLSFEPNVITS